VTALLSLIHRTLSLGQRPLAAEMGASLGKANYCLRALVEKGLVKLGNFSKAAQRGQLVKKHGFKVMDFHE
jgi:hypothetical protein